MNCWTCFFFLPCASPFAGGLGACNLVTCGSPLGQQSCLGTKYEQCASQNQGIRKHTWHTVERIENARANWLPHPCRIGDQSGGQNQKWPTCGQGGYLTPAVSGSPTAAERGAVSEVAHKWANWLPHPCRIGEPHRFKAGGSIRSGPQVGKLATSPLPYRGAPPLQSGGQNQKWCTSGQIGYLTPAVSGSPTASERGAESEVAHLWARWLLNPCRLGDPHRFRAGGKIRIGPQVGKLAT